MSSDTSSISDHEVRLPSALHKQLVQNTVQASTPETEITEHSQQPDISILCDKCKSFVAVRLLQAHRSYHHALLKLEYRGRFRPDSVKVLTKRRQQILRKLNKSPDMSVTAVQQVNDAYELLKAYLEDTYEDLIQVQEHTAIACHGLSLNCSAACAHAVGICSDANERWKPSMEDTRVFQDYFGNDGNKCFFAIYDGYSGRFAADFAANDLHHLLLSEMSKFDSSTKCTCTVNLAGYHDLTEYKLDRPKAVVRKDSIRHILHEESCNIIKQVMHTCEENMTKLNQEKKPSKTQIAPTIALNKITPTDSQVELEEEKLSFNQNVETALRQSFRMTDHALSYGIDETSRVRWSGCSALACVIHNLGPEVDEEEIAEKNKNLQEDKKNEVNKAQESDNDSVVSCASEGEKQRGMLYLANAGNCHAVLCRKGKAERLTQNHTLSNNYEKARVKKAGASVQGDSKGYRVNGVLDTTRGLGNHGDPVLKAAVAAEPYTTCVAIDSETDFLILATNGVWEVLSDSEAVSILEQMLPGRNVPPPTVPGEDDYLRMIKGHSSEQMAHLVDDHGEMGVEVDIDALDYQGDNVPENQTLLQPETIPSEISPKRDLSSRPSSSGGQLNKAKSEEKLPAEVNSKEVLPELHLHQNGLDSKKQEGTSYLEESTEQVVRRESKEDLIFTGHEVQSVKSDPQGADTSICKDQQGSDDIRPMEVVKVVSNENEDACSNADSEKTDFESLISAILENEDGNEADVETLTELHSIYAHSRLSGCPTRPEMYRSLAQAMSERLVQSALLAGSRDNITVMVILLPGCKI